MKKGKKHEVSVSIHDPCPLPSRKSHFIARWTIAPLSFFPSPHLSGSILHANCPIHTARWLFTTISEMGVHVSSFLWDISPCQSNPAASTKNGGDFWHHFPRNLCVWHARSQTQRCEKFTSCECHLLTHTNANEGDGIKLKSCFCQVDSEVKDKLDTDNLFLFTHYCENKPCFEKGESFEPCRFGQVYEAHTKYSTSV